MGLKQMLENHGFVVLEYVKDEYVGAWVGEYYIDVEFDCDDGYVLTAENDHILLNEQTHHTNDESLISTLKRIKKRNTEEW